MYQKLSYSIIGGDTRQIYLLLKLLESGYSCISYGLPREEMQQILSHTSASSLKCGKRASSLSEAVTQAKCILGPIPLSQDGYIISKEKIKAADLLCHMQKGQYLFAGCIDKSFRHELEKKQVHCYDYMKSEEIALFNSIATAEGMIAETIINCPHNLHQRRCLLIGYGRCGRTLADKLKGFGANVTICARKKESLSAAYCMGYPGIHQESLKDLIHNYDLIFNTVPSIVLTAEILREVSRESFIFDLASKPGGVDWQTAKSRDLHAGLYLGLPGKYAPASSADALYNFIVTTQAAQD